MSGPRTWSAWLHRLWLPVFLAAALASLLASIGVGQLPVADDKKPAEEVRLPRIINGMPPELGAPIETPTPAKKTPEAPQVRPEPPKPPPMPPMPEPPAERSLPAPSPPPPLPAPPPPPLPTPPPASPRIPDLPRPPFAEPIPRRQAKPEMPPPRPTFGPVIGIGPAPAPTWIGPTEEVDPVPWPLPTEEVHEDVAPMPLPDSAPAVIDLATFDSLVKFRQPLVESTGKPPQDESAQDPPPTVELQRREEPETTAPPRATPSQSWPQYRYEVPYLYQRRAPQPTPPPQPFGARMREWVIWPFRAIAEPFRD